LKRFLRRRPELILIVGLYLLAWLFVIARLAAEELGQAAEELRQAAEELRLDAGAFFIHDPTVTMRPPETLVEVALSAGACRSAWVRARPAPFEYQSSRTAHFNEVSRFERKRLQIIAGLERLHSKMYRHLSARMVGPDRSVIDELEQVFNAEYPLSGATARFHCGRVYRTSPPVYRDSSWNDLFTS
jgi:hypothetical protein